jgi:hypothetical protein
MCYSFSCDLKSHENQQYLSMLEWGHMRINNTSVGMLEWGTKRINNTSVCWNEVKWESITHQYASMRSPENQQYFRSPENLIDSCVTLFQHTEVLLILLVPHSTILICYWFSWYCIPAYWCVNNSRVALFQHIEVLLILR